MAKCLQNCLLLRFAKYLFEKCKHVLGLVQDNKLFDGDSVVKRKRWSMFF
jgi:hypothetical protein